MGDARRSPTRAATGVRTRPAVETPFAGWKRIDLVQEDLPRSDQGRAAHSGGEIPIEAWFDKLASGDPEA